MIVRSVSVPRTCLTCRFRLQRLCASPSRPTGGLIRSSPLRLASDFSPQSKERIEALISGTLDDFESKSRRKPTSKRRGASAAERRRQAALENEPAEWELDPGPDAALASQDTLGPDISSNNIDESLSSEGAVQDEPAAGEQTPSPQQQTRVFKHDLLSHQSLGVDALGKPVEALIIKNPNRLRRAKKHVPILEEETGERGEPIRWQSFVPDEGATESDVTEEVWANIEELKPSGSTVLPRRDIDKLIDRLVDGFTKDQLVGYFNRAEWPSTREQLTPDYPWIEKQGAWEAAQSNHWDRLRPKQQHAAIIATTVWGVEVQEQIESLGRTMVWLRPDMLQLLSKSLPRILSILSTEYLDKSNNERITVNFDESRVSIYTRKTTIPRVLGRLDQIIKGITKREKQVESIAAENLEPAVLMELGKITNTALELNPETKNLTISWLAEDDVSNGQTEDPADIVIRLLTARKAVPKHQSLHFVPTRGPASAEGLYLSHQRDKRNMPWRDRLRQWCRFVYPTSKTTSDDQSRLDLAHEVNVDLRDNSMQDTLRETTAAFGHILHCQQGIQDKTLSPELRRRVFSPFIPHPAALTHITANNVAPCERTASIILKFAPREDVQAPYLQLSLPINPFSDLSDFSLTEVSEFSAVIPRDMLDICLPHESVDVRIAQRDLAPLDKTQKALLKFLKDSEFNLLQGRLRTPPRASFAVPKALLPGTGERSESQEISVEYDFMGLEVHQIVSMPWQGHTLQYKTIEAGQHGGQGQGISVIENQTRQGSMLPSEQTAVPFLDLVAQIATSQHFCWTEGYKLIDGGQIGWESTVEDGTGSASTEL